MTSQTSFLSGSFSEHSFNDALASALKDRREYWRNSNDAVTSERSDVLLGEPSLRPDILVRPEHGNPIIIEVEINADPDPDARRRVGKRTTLNKPIYSTIALRAPELVRGWSTPAEALDMLRRSRRGQDAGFDLEFAVHQQGVASEIERWPRVDFLTGNVDDLADLCETAATPYHMIETFAERVATEIIAYSDALRNDISPDVARKIAESLGQGRITQGLRLACCIWMSTLRLHNLLTENNELKMRGLKSIAQIRAESVGDKITVSSVKDAWKTILGYNYRSIFGPALKALDEGLPDGAGSDILDNLSRLAEQVTAEGLGDHVDFAGELFPKLLEDRKETAANYTLPTTAAMLARIAVDHMPIENWSNDEEVSNAMIADFACGTGTLLRAAYQRIRQNYESAGGSNVRALHQQMMEGKITGTDINPLAAHMTAAGLSTIEIEQSYRDTNIGALPVRGGKTGALEFLETQQVTDMLAETVEQSARDDIGGMIFAPDQHYSLVIQNPPYTSPVAGDKGRKMFDVAGITEKDRLASVSQLKSQRHAIAHKGVDVSHGRAGLGSDFSALASIKLRGEGVFASVLPFTAAHSSSWMNFRRYLVENYRDITTICFATDSHSMMSSDTSQVEMLVIATMAHNKTKNACPVQLVTCVNLRRDPVSLIDASLMAREIEQISEARLSSGVLRLGDTRIGDWFRYPASLTGSPWSPLGIRDRNIAAVMCDLFSGVLAFAPGGLHESLILPIVDLAEVVEIGPTHGQIGHIRGSKTGRGAFTFDPIEPGDVPVYSALWSADSKTQRSIYVQPTHEGTPVQGSDDRVKTNLEKLSNSFISQDARFTSQALTAAWTETRCLGSATWVAMLHSDDTVLKSLVMWFNSTLGLLMRVGYGNLSHKGRARIAIESSLRFPIPNFAEDSEAGEWARLVAEDQFDRLAQLELQPAAYAWRDKNRHEIDWVVLDMLGIDSDDARKAVTQIRNLWCREPAVHGGNKSIMRALGNEA